VSTGLNFEGILHPKMKILSSFTHPHVFANMYEFLSSAEHKVRYFEKQLFGTIDLHSRKKNTLEVNGAKVPIVHQNIFLCVQQKKETQTGWQQLECE